MPSFDEDPAYGRAGEDHGGIEQHQQAEERAIGPGSDGEEQPDHAGQSGREDEIAAPPGAEEGEAVADQARQGLDVPGEGGYGEEVGLLGCIQVKLVLEQEEEGKLADDSGLTEADDEQADRDEQVHPPQVRR